MQKASPIVFLEDLPKFNVLPSDTFPSFPSRPFSVCRHPEFKREYGVRAPASPCPPLPPQPRKVGAGLGEREEVGAGMGKRPELEV